VAHTPRGTTLFLALWRTTAEIRRIAEGNIAASGLCFTDFAVLEALLNGGPQRITTLAEKVMLTSGSATTAIDRLADRQLVTRTADATDARARMIELTGAGRALIEPVFAEHAAELDDAVAALTDDERATLLTLLLKLRAGVRRRTPAPRPTPLERSHS